MAKATVEITAEDKTSQAFDSVKRNLVGLEQTARTVQGMLSGIGIGLIAVKMSDFVRSSIDAADKLGKLSQKVGITVESLSELQYAGKLADVSTEQLGAGLRKLSVNLQAAAGGSAEMQKAFGAVGISAAELVKIKPDEALRRIADAFSSLEDGTVKTALSEKLLGRGMSDLIPLLNAGSAGLRDAADDARRFGLVVSSDAARAAEQFNDNMTRITSSAEALGIELANSVLPTLTGFTEKLLEGQRIAGGFVDALVLIGATNPFKNDAANLKATRQEYDDLLAARQRYVKSNADTSAIDQSLVALRKQIEYLKFLERRAIPMGQEGNQDARDRRLAPAPRRTALPDVGSVANTLETDMAAGAERGARIFTQVYLDQFNIIRRKGEEIQAGLLEVFEAGNALDARNLKESADALDRLLGGTRSGQRDAVYKDLDLLNRAFKDNKISAEQLDETYAELRKRLEEIDSAGKKAMNGLSDEAKEALARLQFAVEGWGRNFTETLANAVETGKFQFSDLVQSILRDLLRLQIQQSITKPLFDKLGGALGNVSALLWGGGTTGGGGGGGGSGMGYGAGQGLRIPAAASGGSFPASYPVVVGENGPEVFVPKVAGTVIPNNALPMGAVTFNQTINVAPGVDAGAVYRAARMGAEMAKSDIARSIRKGEMG